MIREGAVTVTGNSARPRDIVRPGETIRLIEPSPQKIEARPEEIALDIIYEDDDLLVLNKPAGLVVHPGAGHREHTLVNALLSHCPSLSGIGGRERPGIVHRIDKETTGCLVVAKTDQVHRNLSNQFATRTVEKVYLAIVRGSLRTAAGSIEGNIGRHRVYRQRMTMTQQRGRAAKTDYRVLSSGGGLSLVECRLHSGRTHQIRVHLHHIRHPVAGDKVYGPKNSAKFTRQLLHAWKLGFRHPRTGEWKEFEAPLPEDFQQVMAGCGIRVHS